MKFLVATDGSRGGRAAVRFAGKAARACPSSEIVVLTVGALRRELLFAHPDVPAGLTLWPELEKQERALAARVLKQAAADLQRIRAKISYRFVESRKLGPVADAIAREADRERVDLIVVGTEGHGAVRTFALGSVSARLLHIARRPVTVVRVSRRQAS